MIEREKKIETEKKRKACNENIKTGIKREKNAHVHKDRGRKRAREQERERERKMKIKRE